MYLQLSLLLVILTSCCSATDASAENPIVTLSHGGMLKGIGMLVGTQRVDRFLGVPYAAPPVGDLRFKKPIPVEPWSGVREAMKSGNQCPQTDTTESILGTPGKSLGMEDCLFLDISVPGGVEDSITGKPKAVMVFIHGGGYVIGEAAVNIGVPLALHGDVIVVAINYRVALLGFLFDGPGTGNFGLWDQRQALLWVKENIAVFGGDPDMVTIFGESAGAGSVVAQMSGKHNDGLFKRAIAQSGSLYTLWGWYSSERFLANLNGKLREVFECTPEVSIYECLKDVPVHELATKGVIESFMPPFHPQPDSDFFSDDVIDETYSLANRFDLLLGYNSLEGNLCMGVEASIVAAMRNESFDDVACTVGMVYQYLHMKCAAHITDVAPELCVEYFINAYDMLGVDDGRERCMKIAEAMGDLYFGADSVYLLSAHSSGDRSTYGYHFAKSLYVSDEYAPWLLPEWAKLSADHGSELGFVFGIDKITEAMIAPVEAGASKRFLNYLKGLSEKVDDSFVKLSEAMMIMWTNFAKSGNPNEPVQLPDGITWPQFNTDTYQVIQLDDEIKSSQLPNLQRVKKIKAVVMAAAKRFSERQKSETSAASSSKIGAEQHDEL